MSPATPGTTVALYGAAMRRAQNARQMVISRDPRMYDLIALVGQQGATVQSAVTQLSDLASSVGGLAQSLAANGVADAALAARVARDTADLQTTTSALTDGLATVGQQVATGLAQLSAADEDLTARLALAEQAIQGEAATRAAADAAEALVRAQADAAEARVRADADTASSALAAAATQAEAAARTAADTAEATARAAADVALAARVAALENRMPTVASGRGSKASLLMLAGGTTDIPVVFDTPAPSADYTPLVVLDVPVLANYIPTALTSKTAKGITVTVKNQSLVSLTATVGVTVLALKL